MAYQKQQPRQQQQYEPFQRLGFFSDLLRGVPSSSQTVSATTAKATKADSSYETDYEKAKQLGYTGDACPECGSMTMVRNGTCMKCITCGSTSGCS